LFNVEGINKS